MRRPYRHRFLQYPPDVRTRLRLSARDLQVTASDLARFAWHYRHRVVGAKKIHPSRQPFECDLGFELRQEFTTACHVTLRRRTHWAAVSLWSNVRGVLQRAHCYTEWRLPDHHPMWLLFFLDCAQ